MNSDRIIYFEIEESGIVKKRKKVWESKSNNSSAIIVLHGLYPASWVNGIMNAQRLLPGKLNRIQIAIHPHHIKSGCPIVFDYFSHLHSKACIKLIREL
jgi:hypothetical protein